MCCVCVRVIDREIFRTAGKETREYECNSSVFPGVLVPSLESWSDILAVRLLAGIVSEIRDRYQEDDRSHLSAAQVRDRRAEHGMAWHCMHSDQ